MPGRRALTQIQVASKEATFLEYDGFLVYGSLPFNQRIVTMQP